MHDFRRHADRFSPVRVRVNRLAYVHGVCAHLNSQRNLTNHVTRVHADHAAVQDLAVAMGPW